ncbi:head decoration protein [Klebsiella pneumoniae]|uniref:head decoration protein n=1 Tax=Klebsiella pneumoniae TaxID=573 RepID=UPI0011DD2C0C|nr:head decoration protein [Klebsiella pneumoniae]EKZ5694341.1 head decoration protein [Klebsiella quasipneumoniae]DAF19273.1 MAG TPA: Head decoration protein [Bacteriophage sp.]HBX9954302.1 head decoration protein [Klebsiella variicola]EMB2528815.1 head decoration protein [Klebsiella pneumoniae]EME9720122.1 head decoration protein [Klebsiella pneumoniae]
MPAPYIQLIAGTQELSSTLVHLADSGDIPAFTPLMMNADGLLVPWDGVSAGKAVYLTPHLISSGTQKTAQVYKTGIFNIDAVNWPKSVTEEAARMAAFIGSGVSVQPLHN